MTNDHDRLIVLRKGDLMQIVQQTNTLCALVLRMLEDTLHDVPELAEGLQRTREAVAEARSATDRLLRSLDEPAA